MNFFRNEESTKEILLEYLKDVLDEASIELDSLDLYIIGQYSYESDDQIQGILNRLSVEDYEPCEGYHDSNPTNDLVIVCMAISINTCKVIVVHDPYELFDNPSLLGVVAVKDCGRALRSTIKKIV